MTTISSETLHATTIAIDGQAVLLEGPAGTGKSDLALRLIDRGALLVSDDYTLVQRTPSGLIARAPATIAGRMEVRGIGIIELPNVGEAPVALIVRLCDEVLRLPERRVRRVAGVDVREVALKPLEASAPIKVELALRQPDATPA